MLKIYNYHPETLALLSVGLADPSPLEPGQWLVPAHATTEQPPESVEGKVARFVEGKWVLCDIDQAPVEKEETLAEQDRINLDARSYLANTDWYVIRKQETGEAIPADVAEKRQRARDSVK